VKEAVALDPVFSRDGLGSLFESFALSFFNVLFKSL